MAKNDSPSSEVAKRSEAQLEQVWKAITLDEPLPAVDPEGMSRLIMERILAAESFEEAFTSQKVPAWRDAYPEKPVKVLSVHFNRSTIEGGQGPAVYAIVDLVDLASGEQATVSCGGRNVLAQLLKMLKEGWQDNPVRLTSKKTAEGYQVLWLEAA